MINPLARVVFWLLVLAVSLGSCVALAQGDAIVLGQVYEMGISVCLDKKDAIAVISKEDKQEADTLFMATEKCTNLPLVFTPHKVVHSKGEAKVIEIQVGPYTAYWLTFKPVLGYYET